MANHQQQPAHDFAPAWLKIPTYDTTKNPDGPQHSSRSDEHRLAFHRRSGGSLRSGFHGDGYRDRDLGGRQSPLGHDSRGGLPFSSSLRHGSLDAEDRLFHHSAPGHKGPPPPRRPHSRHDFRDFLQPPYHKMSPGAQSGADNGSSAVGPGVPAATGPAVSSQHGKKDLSGNNFNQEFPTLPGGNEAPAPQPVVTNGSVWENPRNSKVHGTVLKKVHLIQRPSPRPETAASLLEARSKSPSSSSATGGVVPSVVGVVPVVANTLSPKLGRHVSLASASPAPMKSMAAASQNSLYKALMPSNKKVPQPPQQHGMEVLVKHPKTRGNKGDFLKALRSSDDGKGGPDDEGAATGAAKGPQDDSSGALSSPPAEPRNHRDTNGHHHHGSSSSQADDNGTGSQGGGDCSDSEGADCDVGKLSLEDDDDGSGRQHPPLSSSLEAEQRLLREMGWKEEGSDDDAYAPLTEDELREFQYLAKLHQEKQQQQQRNGMQRTSVLPDRGASLWSPRKAMVGPAFAAAIAPVLVGNGCSSSSTSSSDSESDDGN